MLNLIHQIAGRPWAIRAEIAFHVRGLVAKEGIAGLRHLAELKAAIHAERVEARAGRGAQLSGTVAVIPLIGTMTQRGDIVNSAETRSTSLFADQVAAAAAEPRVDAVVMEIDSGGGEVNGVPEAWQAIRNASRIKPIVASANSMAASAALYLASAANEFWITPSGEAGSVGVFALHVSMAKALEDMGESWEFIEADDSPFKVERAPDRPLSEDARAYLKGTVNRYMRMFTRDLARGRRVSVDHVREHFGRGRMLGPHEAVAAKMADTVGTLEAAIARAAELGAERRRQATSSSSSAVSAVATHYVEIEPVWTFEEEPPAPPAAAVESESAVPSAGDSLPVRGCEQGAVSSEGEGAPVVSDAPAVAAGPTPAQLAEMEAARMRARVL